jgi:hypothetical protein
VVSTTDFPEKMALIRVVVGFRWSAAKVWADVEASIIVEQVCDGIFTKDIHVPGSLHLFNPAAVLHRLLGRK